MRTETSLNHRDKTIGKLKDLVSVAKCCHMTSDQFTDESCAILGSISHCPQWVKSYCEGYLASERDRLGRGMVFGCYIKGEFYCTDKGHPRHYGRHGFTSSEWLGVSQGNDTEGLYWADCYKPWFVKA